MDDLDHANPRIIARMIRKLDPAEGVSEYDLLFDLSEGRCTELIRVYGDMRAAEALDRATHTPSEE